MTNSKCTAGSQLYFWAEWERGEKKPSGPSLKLLSLVKSQGLEAIT